MEKYEDIIVVLIMKWSKGKIQTLLLVLASAVIVIFCMTTCGRRISASVMSPHVSVFNAFAETISEFFRMFSFGRSSSAERIRKLESELVLKNVELASVAELRIQNNQLRNLVGLDDFPGWLVTTAEIIGRNPESWNTSFVINRGLLDGIREGSVVLIDGQVIGRVGHCNGHNSEVYTLFSRHCKFSVKLEGSEAVGLSVGSDNGQDFCIDFLPKTAFPVAGQKLFTTGLGGWMPDGLEIGMVVNDKQGVSRHLIDDVRVMTQGKSYVSINHARFVNILVPDNKL